MAQKLKTEEMTEPQSEDTSSKRMSSVPNGDFDEILKDIAKALHKNSDIDDLGKALGFKPPEIGRKIAENAIQGGNCMGTLDLLRMWRKKQTALKEKAALKSVLSKAGFDHLADQYLSPFVPGDDEAMPSDIKLREQLKRRYRKKYGQIKTSPVDSESQTWLQYIYVSLVLMLGLSGGKEEPIDYDGLFKFIKTDTLKGFVTRLAFIGEAGVGKSTWFAKIALDWAEGKILQDINLLFLESFREIKESKFFGDTVMGHFPDDSEITGEWVDEYIKKNQRKVLILLDGLDEAHINIEKPNPKDAIVSIVRGERFIDTPVVITTRPYGAVQIKSITEINDRYTFGKVKGFTKKNVSTYINNFFKDVKDDSQSASTLISFINTNQVVSEYMAPFPIFCCMLCYLWKTPSRRENIQTMETFSQLLKRLVFSLQEQYSSKRNELEEGYGSCMEKASESMKQLGSIAFQGLLDKQLIFDEKAFGLCTEAAMIARKVGILSMEKRPAPLQIRESQRKQFIQEFSFPHKLLQEYIARFYLASLFHEDRQQFNRILADTLLKDYKAFRYVMYFTAAHGGEVGKSVLEALCKNVHDMEFIMEVAFECHDSEAIDPVRNLLKTKVDLTLDHRVSIAAHVFTLESIGKEVVERSKHYEDNASSSHVAAVGLFTLENLRCLSIENERLDDNFYTGMSAAASHSKIEKLEHLGANLGSAASSAFARGLCSMPNLRSLYMSAVDLSDEFYSTMASDASKSKIEELTHVNGYLDSAASSHYAKSLFSMPNLRSLGLTGLWLNDEFYLTMASEASKSKMEKLEHLGANLESAASSAFARGLCFMSNLRSLYLSAVGLSDEFYLTMASEASKSKIQTLSMLSLSMMNPRRLHSILSLPRLQSLTLMDIRQVDTDDGETLTSKITTVDELSVDGKHVTSLWNIGVHMSCPRVQKLQLNWHEENVSSDIVTMACSPFHHLTHLHIQGYWSSTSVTLNDPVSFCKAVITSCPRLTKLSIIEIGINTEKATEIIHLMKTHPHLTSIELSMCRTNADLDPLIYEVNSEGKVTVNVTHSK